MTPEIPSAESETQPSGCIWTQHAFGSHVIHRAALSLSQTAVPWHELEAEAGWAFAWRNRVRHTLCLGFGALMTIDARELEAFGSGSGLSLFGGRPFWEEPRDRDLWGDLASGLWILPRIYLEIGPQSTLCMVHGTEPPSESQLWQVWQRFAHAKDPPSDLSRQFPYRERIDLPSADMWLKQIAEATAAMQDRRFEKVVMSRCVQLRYEKPPTWTEWLRRLLESQEEAFVFALKAPSGRAFMGRSPERLLAWDDFGFQMDAIAGTQMRLTEYEQDHEAGEQLKSSPKERREHRFVSAAIAELLQCEGLTFEAIEEEELLQLKHVQHMRTRFAGPWQGRSRGLELLEKLHPTPAVGGTPRAEALDFLRTVEHFDRGWFAGYIGLISDSRGECAIGIRSTLLKGGDQYVFAGAGIVAGSDPSAEWNETEAKMQNFLWSVRREGPRRSRDSSLSIS